MEATTLQRQKDKEAEARRSKTEVILNSLETVILVLCVVWVIGYGMMKLLRITASEECVTKCDTRTEHRRENCPENCDFIRLILIILLIVTMSTFGICAEYSSRRSGRR